MISLFSYIFKRHLEVFLIILSLIQFWSFLFVSSRATYILKFETFFEWFSMSIETRLKILCKCWSWTLPNQKQSFKRWIIWLRQKWCVGVQFWRCPIKIVRKYFKKNDWTVTEINRRCCSKFLQFYGCLGQEHLLDMVSPNLFLDLSII